MRVADQIARVLKEKGVERVFGLPGGASLPIMDGLQRCGIEFVLVRNESSAVFMAEATARLTGVPGVCLTTLGPGATNAYAGVANAWLDRSPVLIITADFPEEKKIGHTHQVLDLASIFRPVTKWTASIPVEGAGEMVGKALRLTQEGRPGPVHLRISGAVADAEVGEEPTVTSEQEAQPRKKEHLTINKEQLTINVLRNAQRPVIVAGLGLEPERPYAELKDLAEALDSPVIDLPKSKGAFPASHPLFAGTTGLTQTDPAYQILDEADCVLAIGFDPVELVKPWHHSAPLIWISNWANADPKIDAVVEHVGAMTPILQALTNVECDVAPGWGAERVARHKAKKMPLPPPAPVRMLPQTVLAALQAQLPSDTCISTDVGSHKILTALDWPAEAPNRYLVSNGLSAMGFGLPAAIAANLVLDRPTVAIHGDGGFQMVLGELGLLSDSDNDRCVIVVVMNDAALDLIRAKQIRRDEAPYGTEFVNPNYADIARGYGLSHYQVADQAACETAIIDALAKNRPAIIEAMIDPVSYPTAPGQVGEP